MQGLETEAYSEGFRTIVLPAASAGAIFQIAINNGEFHAVMHATAPKGSRLV